MNTHLQEFENLFHRVWKEAEDDQKPILLLKIFHELVNALSESSALHFNTLFARVSFIISRYHLNRQWAYAFQLVRKELRQRSLDNPMLLPILKATIEYLIAITKSTLSGETQNINYPKLPKLPPGRSAGRFKKKFARIIAIDWDKEKKTLSALDEEVPGLVCTVHYCIQGVNDIFCDTLELVLNEIGLPVVLGLSEIETTEEGHYIPGYIVVLPDLLMDVTAIAPAKSTGNDPLALNVLEQFLPSDSNPKILTGHVANYFLDELVRDTDLKFDDLFVQSFKLYPIEFVKLNDETIREMHTNLAGHYDNIRSVILEKFPGLGIDRSQCIIEPSYFSPQFGIKGRLDLYYCHEEEQSASIIELKSSKPFMPNSYGLSASNYHQTLLYELLIKSVHGPAHHRANYILYSCTNHETLRFAVSVEALQKEIIQCRNELVLLQFRMLRLDKKGRDVMEEIRPEVCQDVKGYLKTNVVNWDKVYAALSPGEKNYLKFFSAYITREHMLARIGSENADGTSGLAGLWLDKTDKKEERYQILRGLELVSINSLDRQTLLTFRKTSLTNPLANFRAGDIAVMYPYDEHENADPTKYQLYRANVISTDVHEVVIKLRNSQVHVRQILDVGKWNLEHDLLDSSFRSLYQALWAFISGDDLKRQRILGLYKPSAGQVDRIFPLPKGLTGHQLTIYQEALASDDVYLLWGPPGTGKTSRMLKSWVWYYYHHTDSRIALLAYTNRAVDEICHALDELGEDVTNHYLRIGSRAGTGERFRHRLLDNAIEPLNSRREIRQLLDDTRIFVATIASFQGKSELFKLADFDVAIVDEASQVLEPSMAGLMMMFKKTILIGDHMQLPAVSTQSKHFSRVAGDEEWARRLGLTDLGMSYFERIYRLYMDKKWDHAIGVLHEQGRMHADIQAYANAYVYARQLKCLDYAGQQNLLSADTCEPGDPMFAKRMVFIPAYSSLRETYLKTNEQEAAIAVGLIKKWKQKCNEQNLAWTIGVITPFRAQIAAILQKAHACGLEMNDITVDTVERYQGGARDIIIMSAAVNHHSMLNRIISVSDDGIDRKLNVAVTRARQQFILTGNEDILRQENSYRSLIDMCEIAHPEGDFHDPGNNRPVLHYQPSA